MAFKNKNVGSVFYLFTLSLNTQTMTGFGHYENLRDVMVGRHKDEDMFLMIKLSYVSTFKKTKWIDRAICYLNVWLIITKHMPVSCGRQHMREVY